MPRYLKVGCFVDPNLNPDPSIFKTAYFIEHERGNWTSHDLENWHGDPVVILRYVPAVKGGTSAHFVDEKSTHWPMFTGAFIYTSDSRFPFDSAVKLFR
jgi:hypothetical protein